MRCARRLAALDSQAQHDVYVCSVRQADGYARPAHAHNMLGTASVPEQAKPELERLLQHLALSPRWRGSLDATVPNTTLLLAPPATSRQTSTPCDRRLLRSQNCRQPAAEVRL